jgi:hypothetical protein
MNKTGAVVCRIVTMWTVILSSLLLRCSHENLTGGGTEGGNTVCGLFVDDEGIARADVNVQLVPSDYNPVYAEKKSKVVKTTTNGDGRFSFSNISKGDYSVEAIDSAFGKRSLMSGISVTGEDIKLSTDTLHAPGLLLVDIPASGGYVFIPGTTMLAHADRISRRIALCVPSRKTISSVCYTTYTDSTSVVLRYNVQVDPRDTLIVTRTEWKYSCRVYINTSKAGADVSGNVQGFPVVIRLTKENFNFSQADANGNDIRFARNDTIPLTFEFEQWDAKNNRAEIWVKVDTIYGNNNTQFITMYWGASTGSATSSLSNSAMVFDTSEKFIGVWHLNEDPSLGNRSLKDRTANLQDATSSGKMSSANSVEGAIGKSLSFDGSDDYLDVGNVSIPGTYSMGLWVKLDTTTASQRFILKDSSYTLWYDTRDTSSIRVEHFTSTSWWKGIYQDGGTRVSLSKSVWTYLYGTFDGSIVRLYVNGVEVSRSNTIAVIPAINSKSLYFGKGWNDIDFVNGCMDEIRLEGIARSADWIRLSYMNQRSDDKLIRVMNNQ